MNRPVKCRVCIDGDCHLCTRYVGSIEVSGEQVQDCCCLHQFDHIEAAEFGRLRTVPMTEGRTEIAPPIVSFYVMVNGGSHERSYAGIVKHYSAEEAMITGRRNVGVSEDAPATAVQIGRTKQEDSER